MSTLKATNLQHASAASPAIVLASDGSATIADLTATTIQGTIKSGTAVASTSGTAIDFTGIPSWVKRITVMFSGVSTNGTSPPQIQIGSSSFTTSGYVGSNTVASTNVASAVFTSGFGIGVSTGQWAASLAVGGSITIILLTGNTYAAFGAVGGNASANTWITTGTVSLSGALDRIRITTVNGTDTFDAGTINILYEG